MNSDTFSEVKKSTVKFDARGLVTGRALFTDDYDQPGMLTVKMLRSPHAMARIKRIDVSRARALPGVACVLTWQDIPRRVYTSAGQGYPEPSPYDMVLLDNIVRYVGDQVALVAAEKEETALQALKLIEVEYEVFDPVLDPHDAMKPGASIIHPEPDCEIKIPVPYHPEKNQCGEVNAEIGNPDAAMKSSDITLEGTFFAHLASHAALEPHCSLSWLDPNGRLTVVSTTQVPFHARRKLSQLFDLPIKNVRVIKPRLGGGFGGKQDVVTEPYAALVTMTTGRPAKFRLTRSEVFTSGRFRHSMHMTAKVGLSRDGRIKAYDLYALSNTGAYGSQGLTVTCMVGCRTLALFTCPDMRFTADIVYTNTPVPAAYRGYGGTQGIFATVGAMDEAAERLGMDPMDFYLKNIIHGHCEVPILSKLGEGDKLGTPRIGSCELEACIQKGAEMFDWKAKRTRPKGDGRYRRGVGMTIMMQGSAIPFIDMASAYIKMNEDGSFNLLMGASEIGQGSDTILSQIAAEELTVPTDCVVPYSSDTDLTPFDKGAYASSTTYLSGMAVKKTAAAVKEKIIAVGAEMLECPLEEAAVKNGCVIHTATGRSVTFSEIALRSMYQTNHQQIAAVGSHFTKESPPPFAADFAEVEVDTYTGHVKLLDYLQVIDCGTPINPKLAKGQSYGALVNGFSYALNERFIFNEKGKMLNPDFGMYKISSTMDIPKIRNDFVPSYEESGPFGAKSVSELGINGGLPAISNAIYHAAGVRLREGPFIAERVLNALQKKEKGGAADRSTATNE